METDNTNPTPETAAPAPVAAPIIPALATEAAQVIVALVPGLGQYALAIDLGFAIADKVAPAAYSEIKALIASIQNGNVPSDEAKARLGKILAALQTPENYFQTKLAEAQAAADAEQTAAKESVRLAQLEAEKKQIPPDQQPGFCE